VKPVREHSRSERIGGNDPSKFISGTEQGMIPLDCYCEVFPVNLYLYHTGRKGRMDPSYFTGSTKDGTVTVKYLQRTAIVPGEGAFSLR
jgi:hypothetical protein